MSSSQQQVEFDLVPWHLVEHFAPDHRNQGVNFCNGHGVNDLLKAICNHVPLATGRGVKTKKVILRTDSEVSPQNLLTLSAIVQVRLLGGGESSGDDKRLHLSLFLVVVSEGAGATFDAVVYRLDRYRLVDTTDIV